MIEQWADWVRTKDDDYKVVDIDLYCEPVFTRSEQAAILRFHDEWNEAADATPDPMPWTVEELIDTPVWSRFGEAAARTLEVFKRRGELLDRAKFDANVKG
ncbi:MAG: hypothetical protein DI637_08600 [Citromicrobium sp.]|nr:MAG: hypothetical protein DI637_08600 [Citromicrobium sp.]